MGSSETTSPKLGPVTLQPGAHFSSSPPFLTGILPNITRNAIVNCAEMVTYDVIKEKVLDYHLLTGEPLGSRQTPQPSHSPGGTWAPWSGHHPQATGL